MTKGLSNCFNFVEYGEVQRCIIRCYVDKLQSPNDSKKDSELFYFLNSSATGFITPNEL